jgi:chromosome partitioning protein
MGSAFGNELDDISYIMSDKAEHFKGGRNCYFVPGDPELFAFPSMLYQQLNNEFGRSNTSAIGNLLLSLKSVLQKQAKLKMCDSIIIDTSTSAQ